MSNHYILAFCKINNTQHDHHMFTVKCKRLGANKIENAFGGTASAHCHIVNKKNSEFVCGHAKFRIFMKSLSVHNVWCHMTDNRSLDKNL
jgi:hypothetical protein